MCGTSGPLPEKYKNWATLAKPNPTHEKLTTMTILISTNAAHPGLYLWVTGYATRNFPACFYNAEGVDSNVTGSTIRPSGRM